MRSIATDLGATPSQIALAWVRQQSLESPIIPIIGARTRTQLEENLKSLDVWLDEKTLRRLDEMSRIELGFPHDYLKSDPIRGIVHGGEPDLLMKR